MHLPFQALLVRCDRGPDIRLNLRNQHVPVIRQEPAPFLQRKTRRQQKRRVTAPLLPLAHPLPDPLPPPQCLPVGAHPPLQQVPLPDQRLVADLNQTLRAWRILPCNQQTRLRPAELLHHHSHRLVLGRVGRPCARVLSSLARSDQAHEQPPRCCLFVRPQPRVERVGAPCHGAVDPAHLTVGVQRHAPAFAASPSLLEGVLQQRQLAEVMADLVQQLVAQGLVDREPDRLGRLLDGVGQSCPADRTEIDLAGSHSGRQPRVPQQLAVEVGPHREYDGAGTGAGGLQQQVDEAGHVRLGLLAAERGRARGLGVEFLPLVHEQQQPLGPLLVGAGQQVAHPPTEGVAVAAQDADLLLNALVSLKERHAGWRLIKGAHEGVQRLGAGPQAENRPDAPVRTAPQGRDQAGMHHRRLAAARSAYHRNQAVRAQLASELLHLDLAPEEQGGIFLAERQQAAIWAETLAQAAGVSRRHASDPAQQTLQLSGIVHVGAQIDPGLQA